jgi:YggT family protein
MLYGIVQVLFLAIFIYTLILLLRVMLSWFFRDLSNPVYKALFFLTEPYLALFRKIKFLHYKGIDFSSIAAFIFLYFLQFILSIVLKMPLRYEAASPGNLVYFIYEIAWGILSFFIIAIFLLCAIRLIGLLLKASPFHPFWQGLDNLLNVIVWKLVFWGGKKNMTYKSALILLIVECLVVYGFGALLLPRLIDMIFL